MFKVIGACRLEKNTSIVREKGAFISFEIKSPEAMCKRVLKETDGKGVDVVFDAVGGEIFPSTLDWYYYINAPYLIIINYYNIIVIH